MNKSQNKKVSAEFHTADGIRSVCYKGWDWPAPERCRRVVFDNSFSFTIAEAGVSAYTPNFREYRIEEISHSRRHIKIFYREVTK